MLWKLAGEPAHLSATLMTNLHEEIVRERATRTREDDRVRMKVRFHHKLEVNPDACLVVDYLRDVYWVIVQPDGEYPEDVEMEITRKYRSWWNALACIRSAIHEGILLPDRETQTGFQVDIWCPIWD